MIEENKIQIFEDKKIRTAWNESEEEWYFSIVDVISVLTDSNEPRRYWSAVSYTHLTLPTNSRV